MNNAPAEALQTLLGEAGWRTDNVDTYATDWLGRGGNPLLGVARPISTEEVSAVIQIAHENQLLVIPRGGNTSLCKGTVADSAGALVISLERMQDIENIDTVNATATVEAGVVLESLHEKLKDSTLQFPLHLGAQGSAMIGGLIATNAGGSHAARHGMMMDRVLGLEVVLADGRIWSGLRTTLKDNAGYTLRRLFCGSEGTLGIITRAVLRLAPAASQTATALVGLDSLRSAIELGTCLRESAGDLVDSIEFFTDAGLELALRHIDGLRWPMDNRHESYVLVELACSSRAVPLDSILEQALSVAFESGMIEDGVLASSEEQRATFWRIREELPEGQRREGVQLKHDVAVPVSAIASTIIAADELLQSVCPGIRINAFGHLADGNIHLNLSAPFGASDFNGMENILSKIIYSFVHEQGGSIAAEHGVGRTKVAIADALRDPVERALMRNLKHTLDPKGLLNPGVIV